MTHTHSIINLLILLLVAALLASTVMLSVTLRNTRAEYEARERNRNTYYTANYTVSAELYAVKPNGTEVVQDSNGRLWEIQGLKAGTHDELLLEVHNNDTVEHVYVLLYTGQG